MNDVLYLAWRYLSYHRGRSVVLIGSIALILFLPAALRVVVDGAADALNDRAERTPLLAGSPGSPVDLTLSALYFTEPSTDPLPFGFLEEVDTAGLATVIPLHLRYTAGGHRIVGTTPEYLDLRELTLVEGRRFAVLGEAVLGAAAARALEVGAGDTFVSTPAGAFDVAGSFPLRLSVAGVLARVNGPDDDAIFVDLKTAWVIEGIGHGHDDATALAGDADVAERSDSSIIVRETVLPYTEITPENVSSFHFHGDPATFPVDAAILVPHDERAGLILRGRYATGGGSLQIVVPTAVVGELVETMFSVRDAALLIALGLGLATLATCALVFALSIRLRERELATMRRIGASRRRITGILAVEVGAILLAALAAAAVLTLLVSRFGGRVLSLLGV